MRYAAVLLIPALLILTGADDATPKTESIFNGKDLTGWKAPKDNTWWTVEDDVLICQSGPKKKGSILWTDKAYTDFIVECEFRYKGKIDSGIFLRTEKQQIQIGISGSLKRDMTGSIYVPGKGYPKEAQGATELLKPEGEWNHMRAVVRGGEYKIQLNGKHVLTFTGKNPPKKGPIGLQLHGGKVMRIDFRKIKAVEL